MIGRLRALLALELRVQGRYAVPAALLGLAAAWALLLAPLPPGTARVAAPYLLFLETVTVGTLVVGALTLTARTAGAGAALRVTPVRPWEGVVARLAPPAVLTTVSAVPVLVAGRLTDRWAGALPAVALAGLLLLGLAAGVAADRTTFVSFLLALPLLLIPLLVIPLAVAAGLLEGPVWYAVPTTGALAVLRGAAPYPLGALLGYLALWAAGGVWFAVRRTRHHPGPAARHRPVAWKVRPRRLRFPQADLRHVTRDSLPALLVLSPLLLGLALRFGFPPLAGWFRQEHAFDLTQYAPAVALLAVVLHVPVIFGMTGALLVLDDIADGVLQVVATSPLGIGRYLAYRLGAVTAAGAAGLAVAAPLSGLVPTGAWAAVALAVWSGPVFMLAMLAVAGDRVRGVTAAKALGLPAYLPIALWWLPAPAGLLLAPLPAFWIVRSWDTAGAGLLLGGTLCMAAWSLPLARRALRRLRTPQL